MERVVVSVPRVPERWPVAELVLPQLTPMSLIEAAVAPLAFTVTW